ncbi:hypothetical protein [Fructobacillus tropaeoli]|uniref:Uncharacterized protein n=1 Tax=Fructobacillus tropaeoli TaxID=709323 RepID=A0A3F3H296_9LACO|nr:hypothetical protein [Fructobacillus tropaeoli]GAP05065.1 hypothetical protein FTRO_0340030 [Fructobacillus tropaeoli]
MDYSEKLKNTRKPDLRPFETFTMTGPRSLNGYVVIPENYPLDYLSDFYAEIDTKPVNGLTFGGYLTETYGKRGLVYLDQSLSFDWEKSTEDEKNYITSMKKLSVRVLGFDNDHIHPNEMGAKEGAEYLAKQLRKLSKEEVK